MVQHDRFTALPDELARWEERAATHQFRRELLATLDEVVEHYLEVLGLQLSRNQQRDLVEFLKTL